MTTVSSVSSASAVSDVASLLVAPTIPAQLSSIYQSFLLLQANVNIIEGQPLFDLGLVQTLPQDQALLLAHVQDYRNTLAAQLLAVFQGFVTLNANMANFGPQLLSIARQLDATPPGQALDTALLTQFDQLLDRLQSRITAPGSYPGSTYTLVTKTQQAVSDFYNYKTEVDQANFRATVQAIATSGPIKQLLAQLTSLQEQINEANATIAKGATDQVLEVIGFTFALGMAATGDVAALLVVINVAIAVSDEAQRISGHEKEWQANYDRLNGLITQFVALTQALVSDEQQYAVAQTLAGQSASFAQNLLAVNTALLEVEAAFETLSNGFGQLRATDVVPSANYFTEQITASLDFWAGVGKSSTTWLAAAAGL